MKETQNIIEKKPLNLVGTWEKNRKYAGIPKKTAIKELKVFIKKRSWFLGKKNQIIILWNLKFKEEKKMFNFF